MQYLYISLILAAIYIIFAIGQKNPDERTKRELEDSFIKTRLQCWYSEHIWECVEVLKGYPGPFGFPITVVVLQCKEERILISSYPNLPLGMKVKLRIRRQGEEATVSVGIIDRFMVPIY
jgi:hypothetical protein